MASNVINQAVVNQDKSARSVFVGNIPFEATEEQLKEMFSQVGPVINFRMVHDRESGKPKGYGFIEYQDIETAQSAMRNLNNIEFNGRPLRVGAAQGDQKEELKNLLGGPLVESPYGDPVPSEKAPEAISKAVASLPPEQMFELMKQMKMCIQNNPNEARTMLLQNPQLAYALLQAQIVMKIVDPQVAMAMLHRPTDQIPPVQISTPAAAQAQQAPPMTAGQGNLIGGPGGSNQPVTRDREQGMNVPGGMQGQGLGPGPRGPPMQSHGGPGGPRGGRVSGGLLGDRPFGQRGSMNDQRGPGGRMPGPPGPQPHMGGSGPMGRAPPTGLPDSSGRDPRQHMSDPRGSTDPRGLLSRGQPQHPTAGPGQGAPPQISSQDQEKAALIMQVLQLSDAQIAVLPPEQRESILILKQQIAGGKQT